MTNLHRVHLVKAMLNDISNSDYDNKLLMLLQEDMQKTIIESTLSTEKKIELIEKVGKVIVMKMCENVIDDYR